MKLRNFKKSNAGFTLVELIVVIAIMAILAGVGTVGYSAYIKQANKKADITTVGNIMRAVETGAYASNYTIPFQIPSEDMELPVGFVVLSKNEITSIESSSTRTSDITNCNIQSFNTNYKYYNGTKEEFEKSLVSCKYKYTSLTTLGKAKTYYVDIYTDIDHFESAPSTSYCAEHSDIEMIKCQIAKPGVEIKSDFGDIGKGSSKLNQFKEKYETVTVVFLKDSHVCEEGEEHKEGGSALKEGISITTSSDVDKGITNTGVLQEAIFSAFGSNTIKLLSDDWEVSGLSNDISTVYTTGMTDFVQSVKDMQEDYKISDSDLAQIAQAISGTDEDTFYAEWEKVDTSEEDKSDANFGYSGMYQYYAMRKLYNQSFATYVQQHYDLYEHDISTKKNCIDRIIDYNELLVPKTICAYSLKEYKNKLYENKTCEGCISLYNDYTTKTLDSNGVTASRKNAETVYATMKIVSAESGNAMAAGGLLDYTNFNNYIKEINKMYTAVNNATTANNNQSSIVIGVYLNADNMVECKVFPSSANPRN